MYLYLCNRTYQHRPPQTQNNMITSTHPPTWQVKNEGSFASVSITLPPNTSFHCESDAVVTKQNVDVRGVMMGGFRAGLGRAFLTRESFFTTTVANDSPYSSGGVLIAPSDPGGIALHRLVRGEDMVLTKGTYLAADEGVEVASAIQSPFSSFSNFSGTGLFLLQASGQGILAISAYGSMHKYILRAGEIRNVDNGHLVAWSASMKQSMVLASTRRGSTRRGIFGAIVGSMTSGEGLHCQFKGPGVIYIQSHKKPSINPKGDSEARNIISLFFKFFSWAAFFLVISLVFSLISSVAMSLGQQNEL